MDPKILREYIDIVEQPGREPERQQDNREIDVMDRPGDIDPGTGSKKKAKRPSMYKVLLHNDDFTHHDFVIEILQTYFHKNEQEAMLIMLEAHKAGIGVCGVYTRDIAETKIDGAMTEAKYMGHPLLLTMEPEVEGEEE